MILACWRPQWHPRWRPVEVVIYNEVISPGELPVVFSTLLSHGPCSLLVANWKPSVEPLCMCFPSSPTWDPSWRSRVQVERTFIPVHRRGAQNAPVMRPPFTFGHKLQPGFEILSMRMCRAQNCCCRWRRDRPSWWDSQSSALCCPPPRSSPRGLWRPSLRPRPDCTCQVPPTSCCACRQSEWSHCWPQSGLLTWHPSSSTADSLLVVFNQLPIQEQNNSSCKKHFYITN